MEEPRHRELPAELNGKRVVVIGGGKVGTAVGILLGEAGMPIVAVTANSAETAAAAAERTGGEPGTDNAAAAPAGDIVLVTTNDDSIAPVVASMAGAGALRPGQLVVHMSGALPLSVLAPAAEAGALIGSAHPLQSFATVGDAVRMIPASAFGVTAGPGARGLLEAIVRVLGGRAVDVRDDQKALYHAAAVVASNYLVAVEDFAVGLLAESGFDEREALQALEPLMRGTLENVVRLGTTAALTGPVVRGDVETVRGHISALEPLGGAQLALYRALGRRALDITRRRGTLDTATLDAMAAVLADDCEG